MKQHLLTENSMFYYVGSVFPLKDGQIDDTQIIRTYFIDGKFYFVRLSQWIEQKLRYYQTEDFLPLQTLADLSVSLIEMYGTDEINLCHWYYAEDLMKHEFLIHGHRVNYPVKD